MKSSKPKSLKSRTKGVCFLKFSEEPNIAQYSSTHSEDFLEIDVGFHEASLEYVGIRRVRSRGVFYTVYEYGNGGRYDEEEDEDNGEPAIRRGRVAEFDSLLSCFFRTRCDSAVSLLPHLPHHTKAANVLFIRLRFFL